MNKKLGQDYKPACPVWELTLKCNLKCIHCGSSAGDERLNELTTSEAIKLVKDLADIGSRGIALMGGEVFLRKDWHIIAEEIKKQGMKLSIVTNGCVSSEKIINKLVELEVDSLSVGLDGLKQTHNKIRGLPNAFDKTIKFIDTLNEKGLNPCPITTFHKLNISEMHQIKDLILGKGLDWHIQSAFLVGRFPKELLLSREEHYALGLFIASCQKKYSADRIIAGHSLGFHSQYMPDITPYQEWNGCYAGLSSLGIKSNGDINGCDPIPDELIEGNIRDSGLKQLWYDCESFRYNRDFKEKDLGGYCKKCKYRLSCKGGCSTRSTSLTGKPHNDPYCFYRIEQELFKDKAQDVINQLKRNYSIE